MRRQRMPHKKPPGIDIGSLFVGHSLVGGLRIDLLRGEYLVGQVTIQTRIGTVIEPDPIVDSKSIHDAWVFRWTGCFLLLSG